MSCTSVNLAERAAQRAAFFIPEEEIIRENAVPLMVLFREKNRENFCHYPEEDKGDDPDRQGAE